MIQHILAVLLLLISLLAHLQVDLKQGINYYYASAAPWAFSVLVRLSLFGRSYVRGRTAMAATVEPLAGEVSRLRIKVPKTVSWLAGQHVYVRLYGAHLFVSVAYAAGSSRLSKFTHSPFRPIHRSNEPITTSCVS